MSSYQTTIRTTINHVTHAYLNVFRALWRRGVPEQVLAITLGILQLTGIGLLVTLYFAYRMYPNVRIPEKTSELLAVYNQSCIDIPPDPDALTLVIPPVIFKPASVAEHPEPKNGCPVLDSHKDKESKPSTLSSILGLDAVEEPDSEDLAINRPGVIYTYISTLDSYHLLYDGANAGQRVQALNDLAMSEAHLASDIYKKTKVFDKVPDHFCYHIAPKIDATPLHLILVVSLLNVALPKKDPTIIAQNLKSFMKERAGLFDALKDRARHEYGLQGYAENCIMKLNALCRHFQYAPLLRKDSVLRILEQLNRPSQLYAPPINHLDDCVFALKLLMVDQCLDQNKGLSAPSRLLAASDLFVRLSNFKQLLSLMIKYNPFTVEVNTCDLAAPDSVFKADGVNRTGVIIEVTPGVLEVFSRSIQRSSSHSDKIKYTFYADDGGYGQHQSWHMVEKRA